MSNDITETKTDLPEKKRYELSPQEQELLYGDNKLEMTHRLLTCAAITDISPSEKSFGLAKEMMASLSPTNGLEKMLCTQMIATHNLQLRFAGFITDTKFLEQFKVYGNLAVKLSNAFVQQAQLLNKLQGKGQHQVAVEHVNVHAGGQAIVGDVYQHVGVKENDEKK